MLNKIDNEIQQIFNISKKRCCNVSRHDDVFYSRELSRIIKKERFIKCELRRESMKNSFKFNRVKIKKLLQDLKLTRRGKRSAKKNDVSFRDQHLDECAKQYAKDHLGVKKKMQLNSLSI